MHIQCQYSNCQVNSKKNPEAIWVPFVKPWDDLSRCLRWQNLCGRPKLNIRSFTKICSEHFTPGQVLDPVVNPDLEPIQSKSIQVHFAERKVIHYKPKQVVLKREKQLVLEKEKGEIEVILDDFLLDSVEDNIADESFKTYWKKRPRLSASLDVTKREKLKTLKTLLLENTNKKQHLEGIQLENRILKKTLLDVLKLKYKI